MSLIPPFDLARIFVVDVAGSPEIFSFVAIILLSVMMGKFNLPSKLALPMFMLFTAILSLYLQGLYVLGIIITSIVVFYYVGRITK